MILEAFKELVQSSNSIENLSRPEIEEAIRIRLVEQKFLELFSEGKINGTVHTCVGQEFSAVAIAGKLKEEDWITSNHRCHGHYISKTKDWKGLISELLGLSSGVCKGIGSSQHLFKPGFLSNGIQGSLLPVATGIALSKKLRNEKGIVLSYLGEGTFGEGIVYETMNIASLWNTPQLFVCENNLYSQSTFQEKTVSGVIADRALAFGIKTFTANTWDLVNLVQVSEEAVEYVRNGNPAFLLIQTYRLNPHSKGDDNRNLEEINFFREHDRINQLLENSSWKDVEKRVENEIDQFLSNINLEFLAIQDYVINQFPNPDGSFTLIEIENQNIRMIKALNDAYLKTLENNAVHIGEDIADSYGGAFKVTKGFSTRYPERVKNTPISESAITGIGIGLSMMGIKTYVEIMFGDFLGLCFDQILNNASKMYHMYAFQTSVPIRIRTPMGGKRGYGPTHSQSIEKFFLGIDNFVVFVLSSLVDPMIQIAEIDQMEGPVLIIENKLDYGRTLWQRTEFFKIFKENRIGGSLKISPHGMDPTITIVSYGATAREIADNLVSIFEDTDYIPELVCITMLYPLDTKIVEASMLATNKLVFVEDGSSDYGIGAELIARIAEKGLTNSRPLRIGSEAVPIPSASRLEIEVLPTIDKIIRKIKEHDWSI